MLTKERLLPRVNPFMDSHVRRLGERFFTPGMQATERLRTCMWALMGNQASLSGKGLLTTRMLTSIRSLSRTNSKVAKQCRLTIGLLSEYSAGNSLKATGWNMFITIFFAPEYHLPHSAAVRRRFGRGAPVHHFDFRLSDRCYWWIHVPPQMTETEMLVVLPHPWNQ